MSDTVSEKNYICPGCRYRGQPIYLKKVAGMFAGQKDYSEHHLCPRCLNEFMWRNGVVMMEE